MKIQVKYEELKDVYVVSINGESYYTLPYLAPKYEFDDYDTELLKAKIQVNEQIVLEDPMPWIFELLQEKFDKSL